MKLDRPTISAKKIPALKSERFSFEVDSDYELYDTSGDSQFTWIGTEDYEGRFGGQYNAAISMGNQEIPQNPLSSPTEKQLLSWLKEAESETGPTDSSIVGLVFMAD